VWSWEEAMKDIPAEPEDMVFSKSETFGCKCGGNCKCEPGTCKCHDLEFEDDNFFAVDEDFPLDEGINKDEQVELMKLARELGINTPKELEEFIEVTDIPGASPLEKLRNYRASLGADFDISKKDKPHFRTTLAGRELVFKNDAEYEEVKKMCQELELDLKNLDTFIEDREINDLGTFVDELRAYHREVFESLEITRKPIPEGMTIEQLVEEMEENEDTVECALCQDLFDKSTCRKELNLGWLCSRCADDLAARGEGPVFKEDNYWDFLDESVGAKEVVEFEYDKLPVTLCGNRRSVDDWDEREDEVAYTYTISRTDVEEVLWDFLVEDNVDVDVPGGLDTLSTDDNAWEKFLAEHFDELLEKYYDKFLEYYEDDARRKFERDGNYSFYR
jgi:hypothetical protein